MTVAATRLQTIYQPHTRTFEIVRYTQTTSGLVGKVLDTAATYSQARAKLLAVKGA